MQIKQLESIKNNSRKYCNSKGELLEYDKNILQWCFENAPEALVLDLADTLVEQMWEAYEASRASNETVEASSKHINVEDIIESALDRISNPVQLNYQWQSLPLDFCNIRFVDDNLLNLVFRNSNRLGCVFKVNVKRLSVLFTTDMVNFIKLPSDSNEVVFNKNDIYFLHSAEEDTLRFIAHKSVVKDNVTYIKGFDDYAVYESFSNNYVIRKYLGETFTNVSVDPKSVLKKRVSWKEKVKETLDKECLIESTEGSRYIKLGTYTVATNRYEQQKEGNLITLKSDHDASEISTTRNVSFTTDFENFVTYPNRDDKVFFDKEAFYLYDIVNGECLFIAREIYNKHGDISVKGFNDTDKVFEYLGIPEDYFYFNN